MHFYLPIWLPLDHVMLACLTPLAAAILLSGLDDFLIDLAWLAAWLQRNLRPQANLFPPGPRQIHAAPRKCIAILVPLWREHEVIRAMLEHSVAAIRYPDYHIFAGAYPNDHLTQAAVRSVADRFCHVHLVLCPHAGPTSKADCLNWIYQHVSLHEERHGQQFDLIVTHDAEDLIHPDELHWINLYAARYDFIQTPVLALPTPWTAFTHGLYCDEFAEYHTRDMPVRPRLGGFLPGAGVGTGYRREALEKLAQSSSNRVFEPEALTEDYENGLKLFRLGCSQAFVPLSGSAALGFMATREYFPQDWSGALRQRTRWVMGIALQGWERYGWGGKPNEVYWLWRDRKGLIANPLGLAANILFIYGLATAMWARVTPLASHIVAGTTLLQALRLGVRMACVARIYGWWFACGVPLRAVYASVLNSTATCQAVARYAIARAHHRPLQWAKTEHAYPSRATLLAHSRKLGEILVGSGYVAATALMDALGTQPAGVRLGEYLVHIGQLDEDSLYEALSLQQGLPLSRFEVGEIPGNIARAIPQQVARHWRVLPFRVAEKSLFLAGPELPSVEMIAALRSFTALEIRFHLMTPSHYEKLAGTFL